MCMIMTETGYKHLAQMPSIAIERPAKIQAIKDAKKLVSECHRMSQETDDDRKDRHFALMAAYNHLSKCRDALRGEDSRSCEQIKADLI